MSTPPFFSCALYLLTLISVLIGPPPACAQNKLSKENEASRAFIFLVDRSPSVRGLTPPDTTQAALLNWVDLARLSEQNIRFAVIFFGPGGVQIVGDEKGLPTAAYESLRSDLIKKWPEPGGATPMDEAMERGLDIVRKTQHNTPPVVVLIGDGQPESGRLRPKDFPEIDAEMTRRLEAALKKYRDFPTSIRDKLAKRLEAAWQTPGTEEFNELYEIQLEAEFEKTLQHAEAFHNEGARLVTVDFGGGRPALKAIHEAAGGKAGDLLLAHPNAVIGKMHELGLFDFGRVVRQIPLEFEADQSAFQRTIDVPLDTVAEAALVTVEFKPALHDSERNARLSVTVDGVESTFSVDNPDPARTLAFDLERNVATATVFLESIPADRKVHFHYESPAATLHVPECKVYVDLRLEKDLRLELRPAFADPKTPTPYRVSPNAESLWRFRLLSEQEGTTIPLQSAEVLLQDRRTGQEIRLDLRPDEQAPGEFVNPGLRIPAGTFDAEVYLVLQTGAKIRLTLPSHIESILDDEAVYFEIPQSTGGISQGTSRSRSHVNFGKLGDANLEESLAVTLRTLDIPYPLTVQASVHLADAEGNVPRNAWVAFDRRELTLQPGRPQRLRLTLKIPEHIEEAIQDGRFEGMVSLKRTDTGQVVEIRRYQQIAGVPDDEPVNRVTFTLRRPRMEVRVPRCFRNWLNPRVDGTTSLPLPCAIGQPFSREVTIEVQHTSEIARTFTVIPPPLFHDRAGRQVVSARLVPDEHTQLTQEIDPGETGRWTFTFEVDRDHELSSVFGQLHIHAPGLPAQHVEVEIERPQSQLGTWIERFCWLGAALLLLLAIMAGRSAWKSRALTSEREHVLQPNRPLKDLLSIESDRHGVRLVPQRAMKILRKKERKPQPVPAGRPVRLSPEEVTGNPSELSVDEGSSETPTSLRITDIARDEEDQPEVTVEVTSGEKYDKEVERSKRNTVKWFGFAALAATLALTLYAPPVLRSSQWAYDFLSFLWR